MYIVCVCMFVRRRGRSLGWKGSESALHSARKKTRYISNVSIYFSGADRMGMGVAGWWVTGLSIQLNYPSAQPSIFPLSISLFIYSSSHLSILACGQRAMSLCGPDNLDQFPLQFISQPTTHLVKQHQASQGRATHPSKPLSTNHILFFSSSSPRSFVFCVLKFQFSTGVIQPFLLFFFYCNL